MGEVVGFPRRESRALVPSCSAQDIAQLAAGRLAAGRLCERTVVVEYGISDGVDVTFQSADLDQVKRVYGYRNLHNGPKRREIVKITTTTEIEPVDGGGPAVA